MYADTVTDSMQRAISETNRRRGLQAAHNQAHGIDPQTVRKAVTDILATLRPERQEAPVPTGRRASRSDLAELPPDELGRLIQTLEEEMHEASGDLRFEYAARLRDEITDLKRERREVS